MRVTTFGLFDLYFFQSYASHVFCVHIHCVSFFGLLAGEKKSNSSHRSESQKKKLYARAQGRIPVVLWRYTST